VKDLRFDPKSTVAIIIGASDYPKSPHLANGRPFRRSADGFLEYLTNENGGLCLP
jgi:hypothetical protein